MLRYLDESIEFFYLNGLCVGNDGNTRFMIDMQHRLEMRADTFKKNSSNVYTCTNECNIFNIACLRGNLTVAQRVAVLIGREKDYACTYELLVLEVGKSENIFSVTLNEMRASCSSGSVVELLSGELVATAIKTWELYVWRIGEQNARPLSYRGNDFDATALSVLENVLGRDELLALTFWNSECLGLFAIEQNELVLVHLVELEFIPFTMLWIASKETLLVSDSSHNHKQIFALRVTSRNSFADYVTLEGRVNIRVLSWCAVGDHTGNEKTAVLFDSHTHSLMKFELV